MHPAAIVTTLLLALGVSAGELSAQRPAGAAPGQLVNVGGHSLHVRCMGPAGATPTVILDAGAGEYSAVSRAGAAVAAGQNMCLRPGQLGLERARPRAALHDTGGIRALLDSAGMSGPYVMVGHSYGGLLVRRFIQRYGDDVSGVVLIALAHEDGQFPPPPGTSEELWRELVARTIEEVVKATRPSPPETTQAADVFGTWQVTITTAAGTITGKASLEQAGDKVTGSIGPSEDATIRIEGVLNANKLALKTFPRSGRTAAFDTCELTVTDGRMIGTIEGGDLGKGTIEFVRYKRH